MTSAQTKARRGAGRAAYLAIRPDVEDKLDRGWSLLDIFAEYQATLPVGYSQFAKYAQRYSEHAKTWTVSGKRE